MIFTPGGTSSFRMLSKAIFKKRLLESEKENLKNFSESDEAQKKFYQNLKDMKKNLGKMLVEVHTRKI